MSRLTFISFTLLILFQQAVSSSLPLSSEKDSSRIFGTIEKREYTTVKIQSVPKIDGRLDDDCWLNEGEWSQYYIQQMPEEGVPPTQETRFKILYDDKYIYAAIRAYETDPDRIDFRPARRDNFDGDIVGICFDSYNDQRTGFEFDLTASGGKIDLILTNPGWDESWNAVWEGKTAVEDSAWTAEMKIPLSQLRYSNNPEQVWGLHAWRWISRNQEEDQWQLIPRDAPARMSALGTLTGIETSGRSRRIELMPYALGGIQRSEAVEGNPFATGTDPKFNAGLDAKIGITSDFTMDLTVNPDFGQVEADPSELNLTVFETFFDEKRPFFLEGKNIFEYEFGDENQLFYSRRIGSYPSHTPFTGAGEYSRMPDNSRIISAVKLTGKSQNGLSIGLMHSLTAKESAEIRNDADESRLETVEPLTNYLVTRIQKDFNDANTIIGGMLTATNRNIEDDHLLFMTDEAYSGGLDLLHQWKDKTYFISLKSLFSYVSGDPGSILMLQYESARYMQRPDFKHLGIDSSLTALTGSGAEFKIGKAGNGRWYYDLSAGYESPGLELNDIGYLRYADAVHQTAHLAYLVNEPFSIFRTFSASVRQTNNWNTGGYYLSSQAEAEIEARFSNKWDVGLELEREFEGLSTRTLRGGPALLSPGSWSPTLSLQTDFSRKLAFHYFMRYEIPDDQLSRLSYYVPGFSVRFGNNIQFSGFMTYFFEKNDLQYVQTNWIDQEPRYIMGFLDRKTLGLTIRAVVGITPDLSIQYYGSPYLSSGKYKDLKRITDPRAADYSDRYHVFSGSEILYNETENTYYIDENNDAFADYTIYNPDFNFREFRSNLVARWEYKPGSIIYLVWQHSRSGYDNIIDPGLTGGFSDLLQIYPTNVLLLKINYWFSL